jgi:hypothetical protein
VEEADAGAGGGADGAVGGCEVTECFRAYACVLVCGGPQRLNGCCPCAAPEKDVSECFLDASTSQADSPFP